MWSRKRPSRAPSRTALLAGPQHTLLAPARLTAKLSLPQLDSYLFLSKNTFRTEPFIPVRLLPPFHVLHLKLRHPLFLCKYLSVQWYYSRVTSSPPLPIQTCSIIPCCVCVCLVHCCIANKYGQVHVSLIFITVSTM